jgi:hypothetical protein
MTLWAVKPLTAVASCYPEGEKRTACLICARYRAGQPLHTEIRQFPVIDATAIPWQTSGCPMYAEREVVRPYSEVAEVA